MKRFKVLLVDFLDGFGFVFIVAIISLILGVTLAIFDFCTTDTTPATEADFKPLQDQRIAFEKDHNTLFNSDCRTVEIEDNLISVTFENDECLLTATYNKDFEAISIKKSDKAESWPLVIFAFLVTCVVGSFMFFILIVFIILCIGTLILWIKSKVPMIKSKFNPKTNT